MIITIMNNKIEQKKRPIINGYLKEGYLVKYHISEPDRVIVYSPEEILQLDKEHNKVKRELKRLQEEQDFLDMLAIRASLYNEPEQIAV